jgi:hypothetical protein
VLNEFNWPLWEFNGRILWKTAIGLKITFMYSWDLLTSFVSPWKACYGLHNFHGSILTRRARCAVHALSMPEMRNMYRVLEEKSEGKN